MRPVLLLDIETIPDHWMARKVTGLDGFPDAIAQDPMAMARLFPPKHEGEAFSFPKTLYHKVVEIAVCLIDGSGGVVALRHLSRAVSSEADLLRDFWAALDRNPGVRIATFNGRRFDVPVLVQRALRNGVSPAPIYRGNYRARFQDGHIDLMEILSDYGASPGLSQNEAAIMLGVPGKVGVDGGDVAALWEQGKAADIAAYCTCDVATLALCYARLGIHTGWCLEEETVRIQEGVQSRLQKQTHPLYDEFLRALN